MTPSEWQRVRDIFEQLVDLDPSEARRRLDAEASSEPAIAREVAALLDQHSRVGSFLETPPDLGDPGTRGGLEDGAAVGPYRVVREIGHGGMGRVYLADDTRLHRRVCLKIIREDLAGDLRFRERLKREARLAAALSHPGICAVYALEEFDGNLYLVTEFVEGRTLREEIQSGRTPSVDEVLQTMREMAGALGAAHAKGITHRDLKPENVIRSTTGQLKILDFGLARAETDAAPGATATMPGVLVGTPAYMAPEQINGLPVDRRADLFAFGVVMYEYAAGVHPFASQTPLGAVARIVELTPVALHQQRADLPAAAIAVVARCLQKNADERFATAEEIVTALDRGRMVAPSSPATIWWRVHQLAAIALYMTGCAAAWLLKEWAPETPARWLFVLIGTLAAINGVVRGHLLFIGRTAPIRLRAEHGKSRKAILIVDLCMAVALVVAAGLVVNDRQVAAVLVIGLAAGIALGALLIEPATNSAVFERN